MDWEIDFSINQLEWLTPYGSCSIFWEKEFFKRDKRYGADFLDTMFFCCFFFNTMQYW